MTDDQIKTCDELWREALEAGLVRWMPGMLAACKRPRELGGDNWYDRIDSSSGPIDNGREWLPVWTDPATLGCLLAMVREATGDPWLYACVVPGALLDGDDKWCVLLDRRMPLIQAETEPEALLRAILSARGER